MSDHFLTTDEAAAALRIHRTQLYRLVQTGEMPKPVKLGRSSRYLKSEIEQFMLDLRRKHDAANLTTKNETSRAIPIRKKLGSTLVRRSELNNKYNGLAQHLEDVLYV